MTPFTILPHFFTPVMHFQWEGPYNTVTRPLDQLWQLMADMTHLEGCLVPIVQCFNPYILSLKHNKKAVLSLFFSVKVRRLHTVRVAE